VVPSPAGVGGNHEPPRAPRDRDRCVGMKRLSTGAVGRAGPIACRSRAGVDWLLHGRCAKESPAIPAPARSARRWVHGAACALRLCSAEPGASMMNDLVLAALAAMARRTAEVVHQPGGREALTSPARRFGRDKAGFAVPQCAVRGRQWPERYAVVRRAGVPRGCHPPLAEIAAAGNCRAASFLCRGSGRLQEPSERRVPHLRPRCLLAMNARRQKPGRGGGRGGAPTRERQWLRPLNRTRGKLHCVNGTKAYARGQARRVQSGASESRGTTARALLHGGPRARPRQA